MTQSVQRRSGACLSFIYYYMEFLCTVLVIVGELNLSHVRTEMEVSVYAFLPHLSFSFFIEFSISC